MHQPALYPPPGRTGAEHVGPLIALLACAGFVVVLNETIMGVALPRLMTDLAITAGAAQWLTTGFMLTMAIVIPLTGYLLDRFPLRAVYFAAMGLFFTGTVLAATAPGFAVLLAGRIVQASGTAIMIPLLTTTVLTVAPPARRGRMLGVVSVVVAVAPAIGPTISGLILESLNWRWIFILVAPIALAALGLGAIWVQNVTEPREVGFDPLSVLLSAVAFGGLIFGLNSMGEAATGHAIVPAWIPVAAGSAALVAFVLRQRRLQQDDRALLDLRTFRSPTFGLAFALMLCATAGMFGALILLPLHLQEVLGLSTLQTGLVMLPGGLVIGLVSPVVGSLFDRFGPRPLVIPGMIAVAAALTIMTMLSRFPSISVAVTAHVLLCLGYGLAFTPLLTAALGTLPRELYAHGSALINTIQQVGGAAGTALFVTVMSLRSAGATGDGADAVAATAQGTHAAFLCGAALVYLATGLALFVRNPETTPRRQEQV